jgi:hypothetical protein
MRHSLRRRLGALVGAGLIAGCVATPVVAHAEASAADTPGVATVVKSTGMCMFWSCEITFDFAMAPPTGTLLVDWGDGTTSTYTPGTASFEEIHQYYYGGPDAFPNWIVTMSVNGGPATATYVVCNPPVDTAVCV